MKKTQEQRKSKISVARRNQRFLVSWKPKVSMNLKTKFSNNHRFSRKSQGLSINIIIIAVIALIVLVVIVAIFTDVIGKTAKNIGDCKNKGGKCADSLGGECGGEYSISLIVNSDCPPKNLCCLKNE